ncbi:TetR family transcriptional regulator [Dictyobacter sp. S3.2.2.5]|uniref:TetR family transcriptional regulator n=1 Tax=Dictyobacter halimunensis TaxID=3026934 RepID=A0ABQ6G3M3_9CHLR|nr:TetR family transcriptional regulator [Dictyobacter sp. S3.2.2.5]
MSAASSSARQRILDVAADLFYHQGIRAIGVDTIVEQSGVGKATLYRHFPTKDDLIAAYLNEKEQAYWQQYDEALQQHEGSPREQLLAFVDTVVARMMEPGYRGCTFLNALAEFSDQEHAAHRLAVAQKQALRERLLQLSQQAGARDPEQLSDQLVLLINGALASVPIFGATGPTLQLKPVATRLVDQQLQA